MNLPTLAFKLLNRLADHAPGPWRLPLRHYAWAVSGTMEPELVHLFSLCRHFRCAVDVGANHGYYTYKMAQRFQCVLAFEANPLEDFDIRHYRKANVHYFSFGLSDAPARKTLHIPVHRGMPYIGWASLEARELPFADRYETVSVDVQRLDDQPLVRKNTVDLIKIDVEGHELEVIEGAWATINRDKPVLIIENNDGQESIRQRLAAIGYRCTDCATLLRIPAKSPNALFIPE